MITIYEKNFIAPNEFYFPKNLLLNISEPLDKLLSSSMSLDNNITWNAKPSMILFLLNMINDPFGSMNDLQIMKYNDDIDFYFELFDFLEMLEMKKMYLIHL